MHEEKSLLKEDLSCDHVSWLIPFLSVVCLLPCSALTEHSAGDLGQLMEDLASSDPDTSSCGYLPPSQQWAGEEAPCILLLQEFADRTNIPLICTEQMDSRKMNSEIHLEFN